MSRANVDLFPIPHATGPKPVERRTQLDDGRIRVAFTVGGVLHREDGPAESFHGTNGTIEERWFFHGVPVSQDGPVEIDRKRLALTEERWRTKELAEGWHREDGPAVTGFGPGGLPNRYEWWRDGERHRDGGPAVVRTWPNGRPMSDEWFVDGVRERADGPAHVIYEENGGGQTNWYYQNGKLHRIDGPAQTSSIANTPEMWFIEGTMHASREHAFGVLSRKSAKAIRRSFVGSSFEVLIEEGARPSAVAGALAAGVRTLDGVREVLGGAPAEWVRAFEESRP